MALLLLLPTCASASTLRVPAQYATIQAAIDQSTLGDTILVAPGAYSPPSPIVFETKRSVVLLGDQGFMAPVVNAALEIRNSSRITVKQITINGYVQIACSTGILIARCIVQHSIGSGIMIVGCGSGQYFETDIADNVIRHNALHGIEAELSGGQAIFERNDIHGNGGSGISITHSYSGIAGNTISGNAGNGISIDQGTASILGNTIVGNDGFGIGITTQESPRTQTIGRNVVVSNGSAGVYGDTRASHVISCNDVWNNSPSPGGNYAGQIPDQTGLNGNISANPLFCNAAAGDFSPAVGSPALTQGCGAMGAVEEPGCAQPTAAKDATWGNIKSIYRVEGSKGRAR